MARDSSRARVGRCHAHFLNVGVQKAMGNTCEGFRSRMREESQIYWSETLVAQEWLGEEWLYGRSGLPGVPGKTLYGVYEKHDKSSDQHG